MTTASQPSLVGDGDQGAGKGGGQGVPRVAGEGALRDGPGHGRVAALQQRVVLSHGAWSTFRNSSTGFFFSDEFNREQRASAALLSTCSEGSHSGYEQPHPSHRPRTGKRGHLCHQRSAQIGSVELGCLGRSLNDIWNGGEMQRCSDPAFLAIECHVACPPSLTN